MSDEVVTIEVAESGPDTIVVDDPIDFPDIIETSDFVQFPSPTDGLTLQERFDNAKLIGTIPIDNGITEIGTVNTTNTSGGVVVGHGAIAGSKNPAAGNPAPAGAFSKLQRDLSVADSVPMVVLDGVGQFLAHFTIAGDTFNKANGTRPDAAIQIPKGGKHTALDLHLFDCRTGIRIGTALDDPNCDENLFLRIRIEDCDTAVEVVNDQGQGNQFYKIHAGFGHLTKPVADPDPESNPTPAGDGKVFHLGNPGAGGKFSAYDTFTAGAATLLTLDSIGNNTNSYNFYGVWADSLTGPGYRILSLNSPTAYPALVNITGGHISYDHFFRDNARLFDVNSPCLTVVEKLVNIQKRTVQWNRTTNTSVKSVIKFANCILGTVADPVVNAVDLLATAWSAGNIRLIVQDCFNWNMEPIAPFNDVVAGTL